MISICQYTKDKKAFLFIFMIIPFLIQPEYCSAQSINNKHRMEFNLLYEQFLEFRKKTKINFSSNHDDYIRCEAYRNIVKGGNKFLPFIVEKIKDGDFYLNSAMEEITGINIYKKYKGDKIIGSLDVSKLWLKWWSENKNSFLNSENEEP